MTPPTASRRQPRPAQPFAERAEAEIDETLVDAVEDARKGLFQWTKQWYSLAALAHLDAAKRHAVSLLGKDLVLWCAGPGDWRCFRRRLPASQSALVRGKGGARWHLALRLPRLAFRRFWPMRQHPPVT